MVAVPFIYFLCLLIYVLIKKRTFDISAYLISIYLISSAFSIFIDINNLRSLETARYEIGLLPTVVYCILLTIVFYPFIKMPALGKLNFLNIKPKLFYTISYLYITFFIILCFLSINLIIDVLNGDMGALRGALSSGDVINSPFTNTSSILKPFILIISVFTSLSMIMLLFYFYSICFLQNSKIFNSLLFLSSLSIVIFAILGVDRSKVIYWLLSYGFFLVLFRGNMTRKQHKNILVVSSTMILLILTYFVKLTISRFGNTEIGASSSIYDYAGQSFINFCFFFDEHPYKGFSLQKIFPLFYKLFIDNGMDTSVQLNALMTAKTGVAHGVFNTFMGDIMMASNSFVTILYCLIISIISSHLINLKKNNISFYLLVIIFCFYSIPLLGLFSHFYNDFGRTICFLSFIFYAKIISRIKKIDIYNQSNL